MQMQILLVEDDEMIGTGVQKGMTQYGASVDWVKDGHSALQAVKDNKYDVIVLDLGLPKLSGLKVLRQWRSDGVKTPVLILTARDSIEDRVTGLDTGADDYLVKPFDLDELSARLRALIRRGIGNKQQSSTTIAYRNIVLDLSAHTVTIEGEIINIPRREFALLQKLLENAGQVLSREQLNQSLYGWDEEVDSNALEVHIHNLRKKLNASFIRTIRGVGYMADKES